MTDEPLWLQVARAHVGVKEVPGPKSNPKILEWARKVGRKAGIAYTDDSIPWCGLFMAYVMQAAGFTPRYVFSVQAPVDRDVWKNLNYPIQAISLLRHLPSLLRR